MKAYDTRELSMGDHTLTKIIFYCHICLPGVCIIQKWYRNLNDTSEVGVDRMCFGLRPRKRDRIYLEKACSQQSSLRAKLVSEET